MLESISFAFKTTLVIYLLLFKAGGQREYLYFLSPVPACVAYWLADEPEMFRISYSVPISLDQSKGDVEVQEIGCYPYKERIEKPQGWKYAN